MKIRDGDWELAEWDAATGRCSWTLFDGEKTVIRTDYPVDDIETANKEARNASQGQRWGEGRRVASIPLNFVFNELADPIANGDQKHLSQWLSDHSHFKTFDRPL